MKGLQRADVFKLGACFALGYLGCGHAAPPSVQPKPRASVPAPPATASIIRKPTPAPAHAPATLDTQPRALALHQIAATQAPARVYASGGTTRILTPSCIAEVRSAVLTPASYPLPGRTCREPLKQMVRMSGREWLQAGPELWVRTGEAPWRLDSTLSKADHILFPSGNGAGGLALVVPFRQAARSDYRASSSFELRSIGGGWPSKVPVAASAKATPNLSFDDFMSECFTKTRLATPLAFSISADHQLQVFGTECNRDDQSLRGVIETWKSGSTTSTVEPLPFKRAEPLLQVQVVDDRAAWALQSSQLLHFDGSSWSDVPLPPHTSSVASFAISESGTVWLLDSNHLLWERKAQGSWEARPTSASLESVRAISADGDDDIWLSTDAALLSSRTLPASSLCQTICDDFWHENVRLSQVPHGD